MLRQRESLERSDEENLKEECSSTESTHHEVRGWGARAVPRQPVPCRADLRSPQHEELVGPRAKEAQRLEEERACVLSRLDELKGHVKDLEQQLQEMLREVRVWGALLGSHSPCHHLIPRAVCDLRWTSSCWLRLTSSRATSPCRPGRTQVGAGQQQGLWDGADGAVPTQAEMERALLQGEREAEAARLQQEQEVVQQLQEKLSSLDASIQKERDKVSPEAGLSLWGCGVRWS